MLVPESSFQCQNLQAQINDILSLLQKENSLRNEQSIDTVQASLNKVLSPTFEIVFAGAFSAGKSMLINALLERELLYSAEGHATGTECHIAYAESEQERVILTFLSAAEILEQMIALCKQLSFAEPDNLNSQEKLNQLIEYSRGIITQEGGESKSEKAKQAKTLILLIEGLGANREHIHPSANATYSMEQLAFHTLRDAAGYARRGSNSAVLRRIHYFCNHSLLKGGNVLIDMPGIDAPIARDAELTYKKIVDPETSAVVCVFKSAFAGDMTNEETKLLEKIRSNPSIRNRVFYVFNRIDETWYNAQLRQRLEELMELQFFNLPRVYKTSGLLGFWSSQLRQTSIQDRFGLDSIFSGSVRNTTSREETPQFINAFNQYCASSGKLSPGKFRISVNSYETSNENYVRILNEYGDSLIQQMIYDSGIEEFRSAITRYLSEEKQPQLFSALADDLQPLCITLTKHYQQTREELRNQPDEIQAMKAQQLDQLSQQLQQIAHKLSQHISEEINQVVINSCSAFEDDYKILKAKMVYRLDELLATFSVSSAYSRATLAHPRNATAPLLAILVEALYYLSNHLEDVLTEAVKVVIVNFFKRLQMRISKSDYYRELYRLLGHDCGIEQQLEAIQQQLLTVLVSEARTECDRYVRESPCFYDEGTFSIYQFRQTLLQTSQSYDCESMVGAEPAIRQLLKMDFEPKVNRTIRQNFRQTVNQTLKTHLLQASVQKGDEILQQYDQARAYLGQSLEREAAERILRNHETHEQIEHNCSIYNQAVSGINACLSAMKLDRHLLPLISDGEKKDLPLVSRNNGGVVLSGINKLDFVKVDEE